MTTVRQATRDRVVSPRRTSDDKATTTPGPAGDPITSRQARRREQRRLVREELAAVLVLALLLAVTLVLLGLQWLQTGSPSAAALLSLHGGLA